MDEFDLQTEQHQATLTFIFQELLEPLASQAGELYPGWRLRIYHNVSKDESAWEKLCKLYCRHHHVDFCDVRFSAPFPLLFSFNQQHLHALS